MDARCRITLFNNLSVQQGDRTLHKFRDRYAASLLACLALYPARKHERLFLAEEIWSGADAESRRNSLNTAVSSLRSQLEPPGILRGTILVSTRTHIGFNPDVVSSDVAEFDKLFKKATESQNDPSQQARLFAKANALYAGPLLPDYYEEWIEQERKARAADQVRLFVGWGKALHRSGSIDEAMAVLKNALRIYPEEEDIQALAEQLRGQTQWLVAANPLPGVSSVAIAAQSSEETVVSVPLKQGAIPPCPETLPLRPTRFIGREAQIDQLAGCLRNPEIRLVTVTGTGGVGKTRLAIETVQRLAPEWNGRVWFADLEKAASAASLPSTLLRALNLPPETGDNGTNPLEHATRFLRDAPALLILDNFEHLLLPEPGDSARIASEETGEGFVHSLRQRVPDLTCLLTSRQALRLEGEQEIPLEPMPVPESSEESHDSVVLMQCESVALFVDRAQKSKPDFAIKPHNAVGIADLCQCLEGLPLALEMAATWAKTLTPAKMVQEWKQSLSRLNSRIKNTSDRHKSLWAAVTVSYDLLPSDTLRRFLASLSVFAGGWTLEAAQALCEAAEEYLAELSDRSLVIAEENKDGSAMRYRLLESTRQFAAEQLSPEQEQNVGRLHRDFFKAMVEELWLCKENSKRAGIVERLETEYRNLLQAIRFCLKDAEDNDTDDIEIGLWMLGALQRFWASHGHLAEGRELLVTALAHNGADRPTQARALALNAAGVLAAIQTDYAAAYANLEECARLSQELGDDKRFLNARGNIGVIAFHQGDYVRAIAQFEQILPKQEELEDQESVASTLHNLADIYTRQGDNHKASSLFEQSLARRRTLYYNEEGLALLLHDFAAFWLEQKEYAKARTSFEECLLLFQKLHHLRGIAHALGGFADMAHRQGQSTRAILLFSAAEKLRVDAQIALPASEQQSIAHSLTELELALGNKAYDAVWARGHSLNRDQAIAEALAQREVCMKS